MPSLEKKRTDYLSSNSHWTTDVNLLLDAVILTENVFLNRLEQTTFLQQVISHTIGTMWRGRGATTRWSQGTKIQETSSLIRVEAIGRTREGGQNKADKKEQGVGKKYWRSQQYLTRSHTRVREEQKPVSALLAHRGNKDNLAQMGKRVRRKYTQTAANKKPPQQRSK